MTTNNTVRTELKRIAEQIETLAHEAHVRLAAGGSILDVANELVKNSISLTFGLGELYGTEKQSATNTKPVTPRVRTQSNFHNVRDNRGRFTRTTRP